EEIPSDIVHKAEAIGCYSVLYIYIAGKNYGKPKSNLNIKEKPTPFESDDNARLHQRSLDKKDGIEWVVFESPKGSKNKGLTIVD
ncbi:MAG: hypothetical protein Q8M92_08265, partial [Candidatus Subteraquimicrobiales bacterium]|nr:hypothetical protein [Candidatus Subteraquimicrobiales bacterium]